MKVLTIIIHFVFAALGSILVFKLIPDIELTNLILLILIFYCSLLLFFSVIRDIVFVSFPLHTGLLVVYCFLLFQVFSKNYITGNKEQLIVFITLFSTFLLFYFLVRAMIGNSIKLKERGIRINSFKKYYLINYIITFCAFLLIGITYSITKNDHLKSINYTIGILIALFPVISKNFIKKFILLVVNINKNFNLNLTFNQFGKLGRIRNFVFVKDKYISTEIYQMIDSDYRSTVRVLTVMQLANQLSNQWNKKYSKLFSLDDYERGHINYSIVEQNDDGISVIDDTAIMYHFGNNAFMKGRVKKDENANLILVKNDMPIGKFKVNEKIADEKVELINQLDYYGNTILFNPGLKEDLGRDYSIVFDKIYSEINDKRQFELLKDLEKKSPTILISAKNPGETKNSLSFHVTSNTDAKSNEKLIVTTSENIKLIPHIIRFSKKLHSVLRYTLIFTIITQIFLFILAILSYNNLIMILGIQLTLSLLPDLFVSIFKNRINYSPDHPANLAHSHHEA